MRFSFRPPAKSKEFPSVAVLDADAPPGLAFVRSLGKRGVPMHVFSPRTMPVSRLSRYTSRFGACPDPEHADEFLPWLKRQVAKGDIAFVAPTSDLMAFYMAEFPECFPAQQARAHAPRDAILDMLFKHRFDAACQRFGMRAPWTRFPLSKEEALSQAGSYPYPVILKPKSHVGVGWARGVVVRNEIEMRQAFGPYPTRPEVKRLMDRFPDLAWPMVQEYVPGALEHLYSVSGIMNDQGEILAATGSKKTQQWPPTLGVGIVFEGWHDQKPMQLGLDFARKALGSGIFELELIWDARTKSYVAIDLNPRAHGHIAFDIASQNDLPWLWYQLATGVKVPVQPPAKRDVKWLHSIPYHVGNLIGVAKGPERMSKWQTYVGNLRGQHVDIIHDNADVLPSIGNAMYMLRHPGGLIRPFLRGR